jgi:D-lactate dehydrogenase
VTNALAPSELAALAAQLGPGRVLTDPADRWAYGYDNSRLQSLPDAVALPGSVAEVTAVVRFCNARRIPLVPRGRGTGTTGATVPVGGGVVLSLERMDGILEIDAANRVARVEPGVTNQRLQEAASALGFFWAPDPTSASVCTVGGNLACNAAGPRAVKYGTARENTLGLRAVTGAGEAIRTGVMTTKGVVGYDLTRLLIGSEGTLAIITEATLKLTPLPEARRVMQATYRDVRAAARAVSAIMARPVTPCALELMDRAAIDMIREYSDLGLGPDVGALLMIEVDGSAAAVDSDARTLAGAAAVDGLVALTGADTPEAAERLWRTRKALSPALRNVAPKKINEDVVVPVSRIPDLVEGLERLAAEHAVRIVNFGHAGNGNIHVNLLVNPDDAAEMARAERCLDATFDLVLRLGGTLSGEHGIGLVKRDFVAREIDPETLRLMRDLKRLFDPNGILNPGKSLPA